MEYIIATMVVIPVILLCFKVNKIQRQLEQHHQDRIKYFDGLIECLRQLATLIQAVQESETLHWQVTNTSLACMLGATQYDLNLFRESALEDEEYELIPQIDDLIQNIHKLIDNYNKWQQHS